MERVLKHPGLKSLVLITLLLAVVSPALATTAIIPSDDEMIVSARAIVRGKVISVESVLDGQNRVFTYVTLKVQEVLKGQITERKIVIKEPGGEVGNRGSLVFGTPQFARGDKVLLYLDTWRDGSLRVHQMFLGKFSIAPDAGSGEIFVTRNTPDLGASVIGQSTGGQVTNRLELSKYTEMVRERLAANRKRSREFEAAVYGGIPLLARPTEYKASADGGDVSPEFHLWNPPIRWFEPDSGQPVVFKTNPDGAPNPQSVDDAVAAMNCWSTAPACSLRVADGGVTVGCGLFLLDGENTISFNNCDGYFSGTGNCSSGILAVASIASYDRSQTRVVNGVSFYKALESNISFNPFAACYFNDHCNVQEITTHEMGHALGLHHSWDPSFGGTPSASDRIATMYYIAHFDGRCASIRTDDINGITFIYPGGGGPGPLTIVTSSLAGGTVGTAYGQSLTASGGTPPYTWSLVQGQGSLPPGLSLSTGGSISGTPGAAGTYNFTVQVADSAAATAQRALSIVVTGAGTAYDSLFVSQTVPATLSPGQQFNSNVVWLNTGTQTWNGATGLRLISQNPLNNVTWGGNTVLLSAFTVAPGQQLNVTFQATAPTTPGSYNFQWQVARDAATPFGQMSTNQVIQVGGGGGGTNNAVFVSQVAPTSMTIGQVSSVSVTMQNSGTTTWAAGTYFLGSLNPAGNSTWGVSQVALSSSVAPGAQVTFNFNITAPGVAGTYNFQWGMLQSGVGSFGQSSTNVAVSVTGGGGGGLNAQFISQNMPSTLNPGQSFVVSIQMKNNGTLAWTDTVNYKLGSQNPANNTTWGPNRATMSKWIPVGFTATFQFTVTAPTTSGVYNFQWQMWNSSSGFFGALTPNVAVQVGSSGGGTNDAAFVSQTVPSSMTGGQTATVSVTMSNTGTTTWAPGTYMLGSLNPQGNVTWGLSQVALASSVAPGGQTTFTFNVSAPSTAGTYNFQWGMLQSGVGYFGSPSTNVAVNVTGGGGGSNGALFVTQNVPASITAGQTANVSVTMMNSGTTTWAVGSYFLVSQNPPGNATWGLSQVGLTSSVAPGSSVTFNFTASAPGTPGTYNFQWQMNQSGVGYFGDVTTNVAISVTAGGGQPLVITTTSLPNGTRSFPYSAQIDVTGGLPAYTFSLSSGSLPAGVTLNSSSGLISGTPTAGGSFSFTVMVRDQNGSTATKFYKILIR